MALKIVSSGDNVSRETLEVFENVSRNKNSKGVVQKDPSKKSTPEDKERSKHWATIAYPESMPADYVDIISEIGIPCVISPLHDKDVMKDGSPKKPHYHIIFAFPSLKSRMQVRELFQRFGGVGAEIVHSINASVQYLWHMNAPDKAQYAMEDCRTFFGFDIKKYLPKRESYEIQFDIIELIERMGITHLSQLMGILKTCVDSEDEKYGVDHIKHVTKNSYFWVNYLKSAAHFENQQKHKKHVEEVSEYEWMVAQLAKMGFRKVPDGFDWHQQGLDFANGTHYDSE